MRKVLASIGLASVLILGPATASFAQTDQAAAQADDDDDDDSDKTGLWGLLGLLGLAGLAGLKRRNDPYDRNTTGTTYGTTRGATGTAPKSTP